MRILLIAYEFPPIPSAQSLRWAYLVRELAAFGHQVHVQAPDHPGYGPAGGLPELPLTVQVHRTTGGLFPFFLNQLAKRQRRVAAARAVEVGPGGAMEVASGPVRLNWKGRIVNRARLLYAGLLFPDVRAEWTPWARRALRALLADVKPDVVIVSHEPASTLPLGFLAKRLGYPLVVDLGDPVCAPYTPRRWRRRALKLERLACKKADLITVTNQATRELLQRRHAVDPDRLHIMSQGFDNSPARAVRASNIGFDADRVELLYTGSFYAFRSHRALIQAVIATPVARLNIASAGVPDSIVEAARTYPESIRLFGFLTHSDVLDLQRRADVLVNLANSNATQIPGKIYEYLGAGRPILHIGANRLDGAAELLLRTGAGRTCPDNSDEIAQVLAEIARAPRPALSPEWGVRNERIIAEYSWSHHARHLVERIQEQCHP